MQVLGDNLLSLIKAYSYRNIPLHIVKHITKQVSFNFLRKHVTREVALHLSS